VTRYQESLRWLYGLESRGIKLGLDRIAAAADVRGHPERALRFVHVGGTNGKGSVATMLESVLRAAGYRTGQFASPHLQRYVERVRISGRPISEREAANRIDELRADTHLPPLSFFEYTTLLALEAFRDARCDIVVLEVGLGGRLDSTNIVTPEAAVITNISLEHQRILGDTLAKIAREKAGVLKPGVPCIVGARGKNVRRAISARASAVGSPLRWIDRDFESTWHGRSLSVRVDDQEWLGLRLGLRGDYQGDNAACALATLVELGKRGFEVSDAHIRTGLKRAKWPGRLEWHASRPPHLHRPRGGPIRAPRAPRQAPRWKRRPKRPRRRSSRQTSRRPRRPRSRSRLHLPSLRSPSHSKERPHRPPDRDVEKGSDPFFKGLTLLKRGLTPFC
jgi:dihydrofolate synthase/folylpolyglutamate synthase